MGDKNIHKLFDFDTYSSRQRAQLHYYKQIINNLDKCATGVAFNRLFRASDEKIMNVIFDGIINAKCLLKLIAGHIEEDLGKSADKHIKRAIKRAGGDNE